MLGMAGSWRGDGGRGRLTHPMPLFAWVVVHVGHPSLDATACVVYFQSVDEFIQRVVGKVWVEVLEAEYTPLQRRLCV